MLLFSDPTRLERTIRKERQAASIENNSNPSTDTCELQPINTSTQTLIDICSRDMVETLFLVRDENGDLHDQEGHLRNAPGRRLDDQRAVISDLDADATAADAQAVGDDNVQAARPRTLADYNRLDQYYANRSAIRPPAIQRNDFELKPQYFTLLGHTPYCGLPHEHPMDHLEQFVDFVSAIEANRVVEEYLFFKLFKYSQARDATHWLKQLPLGSLKSGLKSRTHSTVISLMRDVLKS